MRTGESIRAVVRVLNKNSCGSGSICGIRNGKSLIMTNAHVAGTRIGRVVQCDVESTGDRVAARVIMAAYSDRTLSDWAILETVEPYCKVKPVKLSKKRPSGSHYTKGFPRCREHKGTDVSTVDMSNNSPLWRWNPNSIGGQSGSGVWSDDDHLQYGILTWSWGGRGAGQMTAEVYKQARNRSTVGHPRVDGLVEVSDFDMQEVKMEGVEDDPIIENGFFMETSLAELPIWAEDDIMKPKPNPEQPKDPTMKVLKEKIIEYHREASEFHEKWCDIFEGVKPADEDKPEKRPDDPGPTFGL